MTSWAWSPTFGVVTTNSARAPGGKSRLVSRLRLRTRRSSAAPNRIAVDRDHLHGLRDTIDDILHVQDGVRRRVQHAPEFLLGRRRLNDRRRIVRKWDRHIIDRDVPGGNICVVALRIWEHLIAEDKHARGQARERRVDILNPFDDERACRSSLHLPFAEAVRMGVIPVKSGRLIGRNLHIVGEGIPRLDHGVDHIVLAADGRHIHAMEMQVRRFRRHHSAAGAIARAAR